ncbi:MAG: condensation domain-containing protein [Candidatus Hodarchaeales archaeon]
MKNSLNIEEYKRKITPLERIFARSPYAIVTVVARIKGNVSETMLKNAVGKIQQRHTNLRVRMHEDENHILWFTSDGVKDIPIEVVARESNEQWMDVYHETCKIPFAFEERPAIRFILVQSPQISELIILSHHIICDGMSLAYLARDLMVHLGDPAREVEVLPNPVPVDIDNLPEEVTLNRIVKFFINRMGKKWTKNPIFFDQADYESLNEAYWKKYKHEMVSMELSEGDTSVLVEHCRKEGVTVNTALTAAFIGAQYVIQEDKVNPYIAIAGSVRDRLLKPAGESMGYFAGGVALNFKYNTKVDFWENARKLHGKVKPLYTTKNLFKEMLTWIYLEPGIMESLGFKMIGGLVSSESPRYDKLSTFSKQDDLISSLLKRQKMDSLEKPFIGTAMTNLTRLDFPTTYGSLELDRLIMNPGGLFPLAIVNLVVGAVTCANKLSLLIEYTQETVDAQSMAKITEKAKEFLLN